MTVGLTQSYGATNLYDIDILLMKLNHNLDTLWTKVLSHPNDTSLRPNKIINTTDGILDMRMAKLIYFLKCTSFSE
ncbi:MAG: hypothetical protein IPG39_14445 [Bacteroidetes bacterium]|nr:hypothetical protein [Bacteroidota bacterium]